MTMESHVKERYSQGAKEFEAALCCPVDYDQDLLKILPREIIDRDYGCGDPSRYVRGGETVLDLGSGGGKICYMAAQLVGKGGQIIGVDMNDDMLALARNHQGEMAQVLGEDRVRFHKGRIQDLALDLDRMAAYLKEHPVTDLASADAFQAWQDQTRQNNPMIPDNSVDLVVSNCVLNLVDDRQKRQLVEEIYRVVKPGGRVAISDIVSDVPVPETLKQDPTLWSGCISGSFDEAGFVAAFQEVGFVGVTYDKWDAAPWQVVEGIEFRSATLTAVKSPIHRQTERGHGVIYRGPLAVVEDELGNRYPAGVRIAVSEEVFNRLGEGVFADQFVRLSPAKPLLPTPFTAPPGTRRDPVITRGGSVGSDGAGIAGLKGDNACTPGGGCC
ncbi:MAG: methyltransferase domain-containing protein [Magnetococcales bacterium]|nr:methyltransferase domain-containing protein [Magnetococcales bacterium]